MLGVGKTEYIVNKIMLVFMVITFEVPICAFGSPLKEGCNRLLQIVLSCHEYIDEAERSRSPWRAHRIEHPLHVQREAGQA